MIPRRGRSEPAASYLKIDIQEPDTWKKSTCQKSRAIQTNLSEKKGRWISKVSLTRGTV